MDKCTECQGLKSEYNLKFCCNLCKLRFISRLPRKDYYLHYMVCRYCGSQYLVKKSQVKRSKFCSQACRCAFTNKKRSKVAVNRG